MHVPTWLKARGRGDAMTGKGLPANGTRSEQRPASLAGAQMWLAVREPSIGATLADRQAWHALCERVYRLVAESDPRHREEARALAGLAREDRVRVTALIAARNAADTFDGRGRGER